MQDETPAISHPFSTLAENADPNALTFLALGFFVGLLFGVAIMKVRADRKKNRE